MTGITAGTDFGKAIARPLRYMALAAALGALAACGGGSYAAKKDTAPPSGPKHKYNPDAPTVFGSVEVGTMKSGSVSGILGGGSDDTTGQLPVNKYIWQGALDTLSFLPLASTDPFTGVIATDWGVTPEAPGERLKVTAYILNSSLSAASLKVAVYREVRDDGGLWVPAPVSDQTARQLEDAILMRARQIRIAELHGAASG